MARPNKYETHVKPYLEQIKQWKRQGATDEQVCEQLGVSQDSYHKYKREFPEFSEALKNSREQFVADLKGELARLAFKHTLETKKTFITKEGEKEKRHTEITTKEVDGDIAAIHLLLKNLDKEKWADNPQALELKKQELELKKMLAEANNFDFGQ